LNHKTGERSLDLIRCGLVPHWCNDPNGGRKSINAKAESVSRLPMFRDAYALRRCIVPVNGFFEWRAIKGARAEQPFVPRADTPLAWLATVSSCFSYLISQVALWLVISAARPPTVS
jgi:putative SOS response-associated peptidase YedK